MNSSPLFSIIIPVYNLEKYICCCVESILTQNYDNYELILVDDGSIDNSPSLCDKFQEQNEKVTVIHKINEGVSAARKTGAESAKGKYILCVDGDDWIGQGLLSHLARVIEEYHADIVCFGYFRGDGISYLPENLPYKEGFYNKSEIENSFFPFLIQSPRATYFSPSLWNKAIKKELFLSNILADRKVTIGEDGATVIPCVYHASSMYILKECYYYYRYNEGSATRSGKVFNWDYPEIIAAHLKNKIDISQYDFNEQVKRKVAHDLFTIALSRFHRDASYSNIARDIKEHLSDARYKESIRTCSFSGSVKAKLMEYTLKFKLISLIALFNKIRN